MKYSAFLITLITLMSSCYYDNFSEMHPDTGLIQTCNPDTTAVTFTKDIQPILAEACGTNNSCHRALNNDSDISLANFDDVTAVAVTGQLRSSITWDGNAAQMPNGSASKLDDCRLNKILAWINQGLVQ